MRATLIRSLCLCAAVLVSAITGSSQQSVYNAQPDIPMETPDRLKYPGWWPTKTTGPREEFLGPAECAKCHSAQAATWPSTPMAHASVPITNSKIFSGLGPLTYCIDPFSYQIASDDSSYAFSVSDGNATASAPLLWAFGMDRKGQTYIYRRDGILFESHLSYFKGVNGLSITPGQERGVATNVDDALGRAMSPDTAQRCFRCHTTASVTSTGFDPDTPFTGVTCEACHGPGAKHVAAMKAGDIDAGRAAILNPRKLQPVAAVEFCGACHRTWADVIRAEVSGVANVRFQPYRLEQSKCWGDGDVRLACFTCHDPHEPIVEKALFYDKKCLACHVLAGHKITAAHPGKPCRVATRKCIACHMPQIAIPNMHAPFTDHLIRIVRKGAPYPD